MSEKKATREVYGEMLAALGAEDESIVALDADLSGSTKSATFAKAFPERFINAGIAEANMMGMAAGLAACGKKPYASSFAMFATGRAYDQVRNSIAYPRLNVKVVGSHGGLSVGEDGATHQCVEDLALMCAIPGMLVINPCDANEMRQAMRALVQYEGPAYIRLGRMSVETVTEGAPGYSFELGKGAMLRDGKDVSIVANGIMVQRALEAAELLAGRGVSARIIDMHTVKPLDGEILERAAHDTGCIVTTEEHSVIGGLGSAVSAYLSAVYPVPVLRHGVYDEFGRSGEANAVLTAYGLTPEGIAGKAMKAIAMKGVI